MQGNTNSSDQIILDMRAVGKTFPGTRAVDGVDFQVRRGEVHALMGENGAGKSTLMKILAGSFTDYTGDILIDGRNVSLHSPAAARDLGIGMIYQELSLARPLSIAENVLVGRLPVHFGCVLDTRAMMAETRRCLDNVGLDIDPATPVSEISPHQAQLVEIATVLGRNPRILVMDEPTSSLSRSEVEQLVVLINDLKRRGLAIIYISHHLSEVFEVADRVTVLRDGRKIATETIDAVEPEDVVRMMVGADVSSLFAARSGSPAETIFSVRHASRWGFFHDVSFHARAGEILGIAGLSGAGRTELARSISGLDPLDEGVVEVRGREIRSRGYGDAVARGLCYVSEDRKTDGLFLRLTLSRNITSALIPTHSVYGMYSAGHEERVAQDMVDKLDIHAGGISSEVATLSGGNQQKVLLGKWITMEPSVLFLDEPTRGVDIGSKKTIHDAIIRLADGGAAIILISSDLTELVGLADRVLVMRAGHMVGELGKESLAEDTVLLAINGHGGELI